MSSLLSWFGLEQVSPAEQARKWKRECRREERHLDREIKKLKREATTTQKEIKGNSIKIEK